jgi:hypothetical protein
MKHQGRTASRGLIGQATHPGPLQVIDTTRHQTRRDRLPSRDEFRCSSPTLGKDVLLMKLTLINSNVGYCIDLRNVALVTREMSARGQQILRVYSGQHP